MVIDFRGELDQAAIKKAVALMSKPSPWMLLLRVAIALLILITIGGLLYSYLRGEPVPGSRVARLVVADVFLAYFAVQPYFAARQLYRRLSAGSQRFVGTVGPTGISYQTGTNDQTIDYPWDSFYHVYKAEGLIVLATADFRVSILSRALFANQQDWDHFRQYVDSRVSPIK